MMYRVLWSLVLPTVRVLPVMLRLIPLVRVLQVMLWFLVVGTAGDADSEGAAVDGSGRGSGRDRSLADAWRGLSPLLAEGLAGRVAGRLTRQS